MGCNCGKAKREFKNLVKNVVPSIPSPTIPNKTPRQIRAEARAKRIAARNTAILAAKSAEETRKNLGGQ